MLINLFSIIERPLRLGVNVTKFKKGVGLVLRNSGVV
jgi:hypothetical protein